MDWVKEEMQEREKNIEIAVAAAEEERQRRQLTMESHYAFRGEYKLTISRPVIPIELSMNNRGRCTIS
jgi:hypothetical protein